MKLSEVTRHQATVRRTLADAGIALAQDVLVEIADFGLGRYEQEGLGLVVRINEPEYCSKWLTLLPGQMCPSHYHKMKKETFFAHSGTVELHVGDRTVTLQPGQSYTINPGVWHRFTSAEGAVVEEVSTHDENSDSYFENPAIIREPKIED